MPNATTALPAIADRLRAEADAVAAAAEREAVALALLTRCRTMCREDGVSLGEIAAALAAEIDDVLGGNGDGT